MIEDTELYGYKVVEEVTDPENNTIILPAFVQLKDFKYNPPSNWTLPPVKGTPLFLFSDLLNARRFRNSQEGRSWMTGNLEIYYCQYVPFVFAENAFNKGNVLMDISFNDFKFGKYIKKEISKYWHRVEDENYDLVFRDMAVAYGTVFASKIKLIRKLSRLEVTLAQREN